MAISMTSGIATDPIDWARYFDQFDSESVMHYRNPLVEEDINFETLCDGIFSRKSFEDAKSVISAWPGYAPTPLIGLNGLSKLLGLTSIWYKDESDRFGLDSFKALGGAYAVYCLLEDQVRAESSGVEEVLPENSVSRKCNTSAEHVTVATATDGNHGRSVAWGARQFGCRCIVYVHAKVSKGRVAALRAEGAEVVRVAGNYDDTVRRCARDAAENGWRLVSDTSWYGYAAIPKLVMNGYSLVSREIVGILGDNVPSHVFVQAGVGGFAATVCASLLEAWEDRRPRLLVVEPAFAACFWHSIRRGKPTVIDIKEETIMAGLSCGKVSMLAWDILKNGADDFLTIPDAMVAPAMRLLASGANGDTPIVAGESAVAGLAALVAASRDSNLASELGLDSKSRVLLIGTEGASDPEIYERIVGANIPPMQQLDRLPD